MNEEPSFADHIKKITTINSLAKEMFENYRIERPIQEGGFIGTEVGFKKEEPPVKPTLPQSKEPISYDDALGTN
jgi:hypothetical protein